MSEQEKLNAGQFKVNKAKLAGAKDILFRYPERPKNGFTARRVRLLRGLRHVENFIVKCDLETFVAVENLFDQIAGERVKKLPELPKSVVAFKRAKRGASAVAVLFAACLCLGATPPPMPPLPPVKKVVKPPAITAKGAAVTQKSLAMTSRLAVVLPPPVAPIWTYFMVTNENPFGIILLCSTNQVPNLTNSFSHYSFTPHERNLIAFTNQSVQFRSVNFETTNRTRIVIERAK